LCDVGHLVWQESISDLGGTCCLLLQGRRLRLQVPPHASAYLLAYATSYPRKNEVLHIDYSVIIFLLQTNIYYSCHGEDYNWMDKVLSVNDMTATIPR
jgi:hypothetical protein